MKNILLVILIFIYAIAVHAQQKLPEAGIENADSVKRFKPIVTDRPDLTESSSTVPHKTLQIETGVVYEKTQDSELSLDNWFFGTTLLRYGLWDRFELRAGSFYQVTHGTRKESGADSTEQGFGPLMLGFKVYVVPEKGLRPEISILAEMTLRHIGTLTYRPTFSYPVAKVSASHTLTDALSLGYNMGFAYNGENADGFFVYSVVLGYSITSRLGFFGEAYGTFDHGNLPNHRIDGGFTYVVKNNLQLDISAGTGFDSNVDKHFISAGFSWRIPH